MPSTSTSGEIDEITDTDFVMSLPKGNTGESNKYKETKIRKLLYDLSKQDFFLSLNAERLNSILTVRDVRMAQNKLLGI